MRLRHPLVPSLAMLLLASTCAGAQGVLVEKSEIRFVAKQMGVAVEGRFRKWKASVDFRPHDLAHSRADLEIDLASIDFASEEAEAEVRRPGWFDTARFPQATFRSSALRDLGGDRYEIAGRLTLKGATRDMVIPMQLRRDAAGLTVAEGQFTLRRLDFGVGAGPWSDPAVVADEVLVRVRMVLPRAG